MLPVTFLFGKLRMKSSSTFRLDAALGHDIADKRIDVLRRIDAVGSISEAARDAGISYKAAWQAIETLGNLAGTPLVEKAVGGSGGGGAQLTAAGRKVLEAFDYFARVRQVAMQQASDTGHHVTFGLRTSMRNQWLCTVRELVPGEQGQSVTLALSDGTLMRSVVTHESAQLLGLAPGLKVLALAYPADETQNALSGQVEAVAATTRKAEVSMRLGCGAILVGFQNGGPALQVGQTAWARVDPAAVVVALP